MNEIHESDESQPGGDQRFSAKSLLNSGLRFLGWFVFLIGLLFVVPEFSRTFSEFGLELPKLTKFFMAFSDRLIKLWFLILPFAFMVAVGQEVLVLLLPIGSNRRILNIIAWSVLLIFLGVFIIAFASPLVAIIQGLRN